MPASAWSDAWGDSWSDAWGSIVAAVVPAVPDNPHAGGAGGGRGGRGSPGGGGDQDWYKRLREEIEALQRDPEPDDIRELGRKIEARDDLPDPVFDAAHEMAVSEAVLSAQSIAQLLENLAVLDQWLAEQAELARLEQIEIEAEEFLLLTA
jgi:hypothetical protein